MTGPIQTTEPIYTGVATTTTSQAWFIYFFFLIIVLILYYTAYICRRNTSPFPPPSSFNAAAGIDHHYIPLPQGLGDDVLGSFPTFLYSQTQTYGSGCSICLAEYEASDMVRLLPECRHLFHVSCVDRWLKVRPTCPVCRNSLDFKVCVK